MKSSKNLFFGTCTEHKQKALTIIGRAQVDYEINVNIYFCKIMEFFFYFVFFSISLKNCIYRWWSFINWIFFLYGIYILIKNNRKFENFLQKLYFQRGFNLLLINIQRISNSTLSSIKTEKSFHWIWFVNCLLHLSSIWNVIPSIIWAF